MAIRVKKITAPRKDGRDCREIMIILHKKAEYNSYICRMNNQSKKPVYIWLHAYWSHFTWNNKRVGEMLDSVQELEKGILVKTSS